MTTERNPDEQQGGFETSSELRRESPIPPSPVDEAPAYARAPARRLWQVVLVVLVVIVIVGLAIYFLVTSL